MKKLILLSCVLLASCGPSREELNQRASVQHSVTPRGVSVQIIDGCEYVYCEVPRGGVAIVHKANCKNHTK